MKPVMKTFVLTRAPDSERFADISGQIDIMVIIQVVLIKINESYGHQRLK